jgi:hypothetical protein
MDFYSSLTAAERKALHEVAAERTFARGARLMREGEPGNDVIVILEGRTRVTINGPDGERVLAELGPGQLVGERSALRVHVRSATVTATEMVRGLVLTTVEFARFISSYPRVLDVVENQIYDRLTDDPDGYADDGWPGMFPLHVVRPALNSSQRSKPLVGENCTVILTDVVEFGARIRSDRDRQIIRREGLEMMEQLLGPLWGECISEDRGDGLLIVAPPHVITAKIMECIHRELPGKLRRHNRTYTKSVRIRLRIAVNVGPVVSDRLGLSGDSIIRTARLVEAPVLKEAMRTSGSELGIIVSEFVYDTVLGHAPEYIDPGKYQRVEVISKEFKAPAWMQLEAAAPVADLDLTAPVGYGPVYLRVAGVADPHETSGKLSSGGRLAAGGVVRRPRAHGILPGENARGEAGQARLDLTGDVVRDRLVLARGQRVEDAGHDHRGIGLVHIGHIRDERRVGVAQMGPDDLGLLVGELEPERVGQPPERGFGGGVGAGPGEPAQHGVHVDHRAPAVTGQDRRERADQPQRREQVGLVGRPDVVFR